jgi:hypothetical protein
MRGLLIAVILTASLLSSVAYAEKMIVFQFLGSGGGGSQQNGLVIGIA